MKLLNIIIVLGFSSVGAAGLERKLTCTPQAEEIPVAVQRFKTVIADDHFSIEDACNILFEEPIYPLISWRSPKRQDSLVDLIKQMMFARREHRDTLNIKRLGWALIAITTPSTIERLPSDRPQIQGVDESTKLNDIVHGLDYYGQISYVIGKNETTYVPYHKLRMWIELLHQTNITTYSLSQILKYACNSLHIYRTRHDFFNQIVVDFKERMVYRAANSSLKLSTLHISKSASPSKEDVEKFMINHIQTEMAYLAKAFIQFEKQTTRVLGEIIFKLDTLVYYFSANGHLLFIEVFDLIANHPRTKPEDKAIALKALSTLGITE